MLCILKRFFARLFIISVIGVSSYSHAEANNIVEKTVDFGPSEALGVALSIGGDAKKFIYEQAKEIIQKFLASSPINNIEISEESISDARPKLLIFVSTSMSETLLKNYYREASKFGGTLVFKGLPNGSFKELTSLITRLHVRRDRSIDDNADDTVEAFAGAVIDDESFSKFGISTVPAIVLAEEKECLEQQSCKVTYDKVYGNIGIKSALEEFKNSGDMRLIARDMLNHNLSLKSQTTTKETR